MSKSMTRDIRLIPLNRPFEIIKYVNICRSRTFLYDGTALVHFHYLCIVFFCYPKSESLHMNVILLM